LTKLQLGVYALIMPLQDGHLLKQGSMCAAGTLRRANRVVSRYYDTILKPSGLRATQYTVLSLVAYKTPISINQLAKMLVMDRSTLARDLQPLERQGFVSIAISETDNRVRLVSITEQGQAVIRLAQPLWLEAQTRISEIFGADRLLHLIGELKEVVGMSGKSLKV
jgi:DNA-binding MarR family transcriptional regulator